ncbi:tRNA threonylcarbamoyladenosine dehydratase [Reichenbachiella agarivorans]|uniref:tRNA threonylcarbamoyladenosine dehydratase n=1 Tax=Reichenbachiella agarivorans TaxID=2979464 RepID=A0ABY6CQ05_9BACT|nr:tRNA threonylcarbamoyladenosine dehydratase [Reichenbachiella agarivorans]UXP32604.1 tRNA threonylcarbamoyladenosine dehydratase [Reichenbachiella agarivorans]
MSDWLERTELLIGKDALNKLKQAHVLVVGLGGVGSYAAETLVRAGLGKITIIDGDDVDPTNKNRQLQALDSTVGQQKAHVLKERFLDINSDLEIRVLDAFMEPDAMHSFLLENQFDFVMDCIDSIKPKLSMILILRRMKFKFISSMGAGGKMDPSKIRVTDVFKTTECKFAQQVRKMLKAKGIDRGVLCVYSEEIQPKHALKLTDGTHFKKSFYGTISYMPAMFGMTMAAEVIKRITANQ